MTNLTEGEGVVQCKDASPIQASQTETQRAAIATQSTAATRKGKRKAKKPPKAPAPAPAPPPKPKEKVSNRKRSGCWDHFTKHEEDGKVFSSCNYYGKVYMAHSKDNGTTAMNNHTPVCPKYIKELEGGQKTLSFQPKKGEGFNVVATSFSMEAARKDLAEMVIIDELPFRFVENYGFRKFCRILQPKFLNIPSRQTVARNVIQIYDDERMKLKKSLKGRRVCLTTDTWTLIQNLNYMCLTCHFIDDEWKLHKRILNFCQVDDHKGETIGKKIEECLLEWNIGSIFTLTVDNASSNNTTIKFLEANTKE